MKKLISTLCAIAIAASALTGFTVSASAQNTSEQSAYTLQAAADVTITPDSSDAKKLAVTAAQTPLDGVLIHAVYKSDKTLESVKTYDLKVSDASEVVVTLESDYKDGDKLLVWDSLQGMKPYTVAFGEPEAPATEEPAVETEAPAATDVPATDVPATDVPATDVPATDVPATAVPATNVPATDVPATAVPATDVPATAVPATDVPATAVPATDVPATEVPAATIEPAQPTNAPVATDEPAPTEAPTYSVNGTVTDSKDAPVADAKVTLGDKETTTDADGKYTFDKVEPGSYQLTVTKDDITNSDEVEVTDADKTIAPVKLSDNTSAVVTVEGDEEEDAPAIVVSGLNDEAEAAAEEVEGAEDKKITVTMKIKTLKKSAVEAAVSEAIDEVASDTEELDYIDIDLLRTVEETTETGSTQKITTDIEEASNIIKIVVPMDTTDKEDVTVYRYHDGKAEAMQKDTPNADGEYYTVSDSRVTIYAKKFSTYAIGYNTVEEKPTPAPAATSEPAAATGEPATATGEPAAATGEPAAATNEPATATNEPATATGEPATATNEPATATGEPAAATNEPATATGEPAAATDEPAKATDEPEATASPEPAKHTITFDAGEGTFSDGESKKLVDVYDGSKVKRSDIVEPKPADGYVFTGWKRGTADKSIADIIAETVTKDVTYTAAYELDIKDFALTYTTDDGIESIAVSLDNEDAVIASGTNVTAGKTVSVIPTFKTGYELNAINTTPTVQTSAVQNGVTFVMPKSVVAVNVTSKKINYTASAVNSGQNGQIALDASTYNYGDTVTVSVVANSVTDGYELSAIAINDANGQPLSVQPVKTADGYIFTMPAENVQVVPTFTQTGYKIETAVDPAGKGTITIKDENDATINIANAVKENTKFKVVAEATDEEYELDTIVVKPETSTALNADNGLYTMPEENVTVTATFKAKTYAITKADASNGSFTLQDAEGAEIASGAEKAKGTAITVVPAPAKGYELDAITVNEGAVTVENGGFTMPNAAVTVAVTFKKTGYGVSVTTAPATGAGTAQASAEKATIGDPIDITVAPDDKYELKSITYTVNGGEAANVDLTSAKKSDNVYTITPITASTETPGAVAVTVTYGVKAAKKIVVEGESIIKPAQETAGTYTAKVYADAEGTIEITDLVDASTIEWTLTDSDNIGATIPESSTGKSVVVSTSSVANTVDKEITLKAAIGDVDDTKAIEVVDATTYTVTIADSTNGQVTADKNPQRQGLDVVLTIAPAANYELDELKVGADANSAAKVDVTGNTYTISAIDADKYVAATFKRIEKITVVPATLNDTREGEFKLYDNAQDQITAGAPATNEGVTTIAFANKSGEQLKEHQNGAEPASMGYWAGVYIGINDEYDTTKHFVIKANKAETIGADFFDDAETIESRLAKDDNIQTVGGANFKQAIVQYLDFGTYKNASEAKKFYAYIESSNGDPYVYEFDFSSVALKEKTALQKPTIKGDVEQGATLTAALAEGQEGAKAVYQWYAKGADQDDEFEAIADATAATYAIPADAAVGTTYKVEVTAVDNTYTGTVESDPTAALVAKYTITKDEDSAGYTAKIGDKEVTTAKAGDTITIVPAEIAESKKLNAITVIGPDGAVAVSADKTFTMPAGNVTVKVELADKTAITAVALSSSAPEVNVEVTTTLTPNDVPADAVTYQWYTTDGETDTKIDDATSASYTPAADDVGKKLKVVAAAKGDDYYGEVSATTTENVAAEKFLVTLTEPDAENGTLTFAEGEPADHRYAKDAAVKVVATPAGDGKKVLAVAAAWTGEGEANLEADGAENTYKLTAMPAAAVTISATFTDVYTVTFDYNGGKVGDDETTKAVKVDKNEDYGTLPEPTKTVEDENWRFAGWHDTADTDNESSIADITAETKATENKTYKAVWVQQFTVTVPAAADVKNGTLAATTPGDSDAVALKEGANLVDKNTVITLTATPDSTNTTSVYAIVVDGTAVEEPAEAADYATTGAKTATVTVDADKTVTAEFLKKTATYDFEDSTIHFSNTSAATASQRLTLSVDADSTLSENNHILQLKCINSNSRSSALLDLTNDLANAEFAKITFDAKANAQATRAWIGLIDTNIRGKADGNSNQGTVDKTGSIFNVYKNSNDLIFRVNSNNNGKTNYGNAGNWQHYEITVNYKTRKVTYNITQQDGTAASSGTDLDYTDTANPAMIVNAISIYQHNIESTFIDNINVYKVEGTANTATVKYLDAEDSTEIKQQRTFNTVNGIMAQATPADKSTFEDTATDGTKYRYSYSEDVSTPTVNVTADGKNEIVLKFAKEPYASTPITVKTEAADADRTVTVYVDGTTTDTTAPTPTLTKQPVKITIPSGATEATSDATATLKLLPGTYYYYTEESTDFFAIPKVTDEDVATDNTKTATKLTVGETNTIALPKNTKVLATVTVNYVDSTSNNTVNTVTYNGEKFGLKYTGEEFTLPESYYKGVTIKGNTTPKFKVYSYVEERSDSTTINELQDSNTINLKVKVKEDGKEFYVYEDNEEYEGNSDITTSTDSTAKSIWYFSKDDGGVSLETGDATYGKYVKYVVPTANENMTYRVPETAQLTGKYVVSFDAALTKGQSDGLSTVTIQDMDNTTIFQATGGNNTLTVTGGNPASGTTLTTTHAWNHFEITVDTTNKTTSVSVTEGSTGTYTGTATFTADKGLNTIIFKSPKNWSSHSQYMTVDNLKVYAAE